jgi:kynurenine formamidase
VATKWEAVPDFRQHVYARHDPDTPMFPDQYPGVTGASDSISMSTHSGTHMDSLSHIALDRELFDGTRIDEPGVQEEDGVRLRTRENFSPIFSRGILLDFPRLLGVEHVPSDYVIRRPQLDQCLAAEGIDVRRGDTVLFRTGWDTLVEDPELYLGEVLPGPSGDVARHLVELGVVSTGSDTMPFEAVPGDIHMEVHYEMLDLRELAAAEVYEFLFVAAPLRLRGGTGSPLNPLAVLPPLG